LKREEVEKKGESRKVFDSFRLREGDLLADSHRKGGVDEADSSQNLTVSPFKGKD